MLFHTSSSASAPVRRSKSLSSVRTHHISPSKSESIDPETARHHALTAASLAFERAGQSEGSNNHHLIRQSSITSYHAGSQHGPARRQSVRFAGPTAVPQRQLIRSGHSSSVRSNRTTSPTSMATWRSVRRYQQYGSNSGPEAPEQPALYDDGLFAPMDDIASAPSSYRRIRKSKSMFDPRKPPQYHSRVVNNSYIKAQSMRVGPNTRGNSLRLSKSISILGGRRNRMHQQSEQGQEAAVQLARDMYFQQIEGQTRDSLYSSATPPSSRRRQGLFRRTARSSSDTNDSRATYSPNQQPQLSKRGFSTKARSISASIKKGFKRVFHRSSGLAGDIPVQHLEASRNHYGDSANGGYGEMSTPETRMFSNVTSGMASIRVASPNMEPRSRTGSIHSAQNEGGFSNDRSRVTSWTNSTAANTLATVHAAAVKRLSIIQEHGDPYHASASGSPHRAGNSPYSAFRGPMEGSTTPSHGSDPVDSHRVYSALMKRIESNSPEANTTPNDSVPATNYNGTYLDIASIPARSSSKESGQTNARVRRGADRSLPDRGTESQPELGHVYEDVETPDRSPSQALVISKNRVADYNPSPHKNAMETRLESCQAMDTTHLSIGIPMIERTFTEHDLVPRQSSVAPTGSVYSRSPSGNTPKATGSSISVHNSGNPHPSESVNFLEASNYHAPIAISTSRQSSLAAKSNLEWTDFNSLSQGHSENPRLLGPRPLRNQGHRRENTQINDDDIAISSEMELPRPRGVPEEYSHFRWSRAHELSGQGSALKELNITGGNLLNLRTRQRRSPTSIKAWDSSNGVENEPPRLADVFRSPNEIRPTASSLFLRSGSNSPGSLQPSPDGVDSLKSPNNASRTRSFANAGTRYSPERARRLAAYKRNYLIQRDDAGRSENRNGENAHAPTDENAYDANGTGLFELRGDDPETVDAYLRSRRQNFAGPGDERDAFL